MELHMEYQSLYGGRGQRQCLKKMQHSSIKFKKNLLEGGWLYQHFQKIRLGPINLLFAKLELRENGDHPLLEIGLRHGY